MAIELTSKTNTEAASAEYPYGQFKDNTGSNNGTPLNKAVLEDYLQFFHKMMSEAGITYTGVPDNEYDGWQFWEAFLANLSIQQTPLSAQDYASGSSLVDWGTYNCFFYKGKDGRVYINGTINFQGTPGPGIEKELFVLPVGYRPVAETYLIQVCLDGTIGAYRLWIRPSGSVTLLSSSDADTYGQVFATECSFRTS